MKIHMRYDKEKSEVVAVCYGDDPAQFMTATISVPSSSQNVEREMVIAGEMALKMFLGTRNATPLVVVQG
jgi:phage-related protein